MVELLAQAAVPAPGPVADVVHLNERALEAPAGVFPAPAAAGANLLPASAAQIVALRPVGSSVDSHPEVREPVLDEARLESSCMGSPELKNVLVGTFLNHIRPRLKRLREVAAAGDACAVEVEAHGLKGMSATIGAVCCADAFARVEHLGREKHLEPVGPMLDYAEIEVGRVEALIGPMLRAA
jgi:HPt (histidine-containing phosphotransfer) domain-containing protein